MTGVHRAPRVAVLAEGLFARETAKTAIGALRYAPYPIVCVIDSTRAQSDAAAHVGTGAGIPVVGSLAEALELRPSVLLIGTASAGGRIPETYRPILAEALSGGLEVWNGLHERVLADPVLAQAAARGGGRVWELREPPPDLPVGGNRRPREGAKIVLTVGTDAAVGKMTAALEIVAGLRRAGERAAFVATGQTGIAIAGRGISVDAVVADFIAGATERMVCDAADGADWVIVEGQGSLMHPGFSGVTLGLLHGSAPDAMVLCHDVSRRTVKGNRYELPLRPLEDCVRIYEEAAAWRQAPGHPRARVVSVALNTATLAEDAAWASVEDAVRRTGLAAADPVREGPEGADRLVLAIRRALAR